MQSRVWNRKGDSLLCGCPSATYSIPCCRFCPEWQPYLCSRCGKWHLSNPRYRDSAKIFIKECLHKKVYYNLGMAKNVANKVKEERGIELHAYRCPHCGHYHLTKNVVNFNSKLF